MAEPGDYSAEHLRKADAGFVPRVNEQASEIAHLEEVRVNYLGKKGEITGLLKTLGKLAPEERKDAGQVINQAKTQVQDAITVKREALANAALEQKLAAETIDVTLPGRTMPAGGLHPAAAVPA